MKIDEVILNSLKAEIERVYDFSIDTPADYEDLAKLINKKLLTIKPYKRRKESGDKSTQYSLSTSTLKRVFGYKRDSYEFTAETLKMMACCIGHKNWDGFITSVIECDKIFDLYKFDPEEDVYVVEMLPPRTKIRFNLGTYSKNFILEKGESHRYAYTILAVMGLKFRRKVGDSFFAPGFGINQIDDFKEPQIIITDPQAWFDEPDQADLKEQKDYFIL